MQRTANSNLEKRYGNELSSFLIAKNWWIRKLHGNLYQRGLPDFLVARKKDGKLLLIEMKAFRSKGECYQLDLIDALEGPQIGNVLMLAKIRAPIWVIAGSSQGWLAIHAPFKQAEKVYPLTIEELYDELNK